MEGAFFCVLTYFIEDLQKVVTMFNYVLLVPHVRMLLIYTSIKRWRYSRITSFIKPWNMDGVFTMPYSMMQYS